MHALLAALDRFFASLPARLRRRRALVWLVALIVVGASAAGLPRLRVDMSMESLFFADDPVRLLHERFKETFGSDEGVYIVYEARDGDVFSPTSLAAARAVQDELLERRAGMDADGVSPLDHIVDVNTLVNVSYLEVRGDTLVSRDFVEAIPRSDPERETLRRVALDHEDYPDFYLSGDSRYGGVWIRTDLGLDTPEDVGVDEDFLGSEVAARVEGETPASQGSSEGTDMVEFAAFAAALNQVLEDPAYTDALAFYPVGNPIMMGFFNDVFMVELEAFFAIALLIMMVVLAVLFRSLAGVVWPIGLVALTTVVSLGLVGWIGWTLSMMVTVLVMLLLVVGIADAVHILSGYAYFRRAGDDHERALQEVFRRSGLACLLTSVTTGLGMLSLAIVPIAPIRAFGFSAAIGVLVAFALTALLLPVMLDLWAPAPRVVAGGTARTPRLHRVLTSLEPIAERHPVPIVVVFAVVGLAGVYGVSQVHVDSNLVEIIRPGLPIRTAHELVDRVMGGTQGMEIYLDLGETDALKDPRVLNAMERLQDRLEREYPEFVVRTDSLVNVTKSSFRALNEDRSEMYRIPQERTALAQTLLLFELANPEDREVMVPDDYGEGRITIRLLNYGSQRYVEFFDEVQARTDEVFAPLRAHYPDMDVGLTGSLPMMMKMADYIARAQIQSFALVLVVVTVLLLLVFASVRAGLVAMVPNVYPVLVTFGVMGLWNIPLDADTLIIAPMLIGIAVDDTIHFITHYRAAVVESGDVRRSIAATIEEVGQAIVFTSVILVLGFLILIGSNHQGMAHFGFLIAIAFGTAVLADLLLLPVLLKRLGVRFGR